MGETAFQPSAFQNNAFQIFGTQGNGGGGFASYSHPVKQLSIDYEKYRKLGGKRLLAAIEPYAAVINDDELIRRRKARYIADEPLPAIRIDFAGLYNNALAKQKLEAEIKRLKLMLERQEEEELLIIMLMSI